MKNKIQNILVPTDFSESGNNALQIAVDICKKNRGTLHLLHVVESRYIITAPEPGISLPSIVNEIDADARTRLYNTYESLMRTHGISVQIHMPTGIPYDEICKAAEEMPIDLIVMGTHGASGFREFFMGTTAYSVIKNTIKPVLTIPYNYLKSGFEKVLFPVRSVPGLKEKFDFLLPVLEKQAIKEIYVAVLAKEGRHEELFDNKDELYDIVRFLKHNHIPHTKELHCCKNFADKVIELSELHSADLIVINATLDYKWTQFFVGPYTQQVVNHSRIPVLSHRSGVNVPLEVKKDKEKDFVKKTSGM